jgi:holin-like protein
MNRLRALPSVVLQIAGLWAISWLAHQLVTWFHLPLPGNVMALLLTLAALGSHALPLKAIEHGGSFLLTHMSLLFIPFAAGLSRLFPLLAAHGLAIGTVLIISAVLGYAITGRVTQAGLRMSTRFDVLATARHG